MIQSFGGRRVLFVMAARLEYGPALGARIAPLICGVGPVEAAVALTATLAGVQQQAGMGGGLPDLVVSLGSAGSARLAQGSVHQVAAVAWRDMDASPLGIPAGVVPFTDLPRLLPLTGPRLPLPQATLSTGADVVSGAAYARIAEDMVDMETYAHLRAAMRFGVPLIGLRGISDGAEELGRMGDWSDALPLIDARLAEAVDLLEAELARG